LSNKVLEIPEGTALPDSLKLELGLYLREAGPRWDSIYLLALAQDYYNLNYRG
jgi:hypothetical protein